MTPVTPCFLSSLWGGGSIFHLCLKGKQRERQFEAANAYLQRQKALLLRAKANTRNDMKLLAEVCSLGPLPPRATKSKPGYNGEPVGGVFCSGYPFLGVRERETNGKKPHNLMGGPPTNLGDYFGNRPCSMPMSLGTRGHAQHTLRS